MSEEQLTRETAVKRFGHDCTWAWIVRHHFEDLFEHGKGRDALLHRAARYFFRDMNLVLQEYVLLQYACLADPGKRPLSVHYLAKLDWPDDVGKRLKKLASAIGEFAKPIQTARNKIIAHHDRDLPDEPLGTFEEIDEEEFWKNLQEFVNLAHEHTLGGPFPINPVSMGDEIIKTLLKAQDYDKLFEGRPREVLERKKGWPDVGPPFSNKETA